MQREGGCAVVRQGHLIAVVVSLLMGCAVLFMVVGCAGVRSEAPQKEEQTHYSDRCEGTRTIDRAPTASASARLRPLRGGLAPVRAGCQRSTTTWTPRTSRRVWRLSWSAGRHGSTKWSRSQVVLVWA